MNAQDLDDRMLAWLERMGARATQAPFNVAFKGLHFRRSVDRLKAANLVAEVDGVLSLTQLGQIRRGVQ